MTGKRPFWFRKKKGRREPGWSPIANGPKTPEAFAFRDWKEENPLYRYKARMQMSTMEFSSRLGISVNTITKWMNGSGTPSVESMAKLIEFTGNPALPTEWRLWLADRPKKKAKEEENQ